MKNREKFAKEILDIACKGNRFGVTKAGEIISCPETDCIECLFNDGYDCDISLEQWSESEYLEKPTITSKEKAFLDLLLPKWKYIERDKNNELYVYQFKSTCNDGSRGWILNNGIYYRIPVDMYGNMFAFIKWKDEEPWDIEDLKKLEVKDE